MELGGIEEDEEVVGSWGFCGGEVTRDGVVVEVVMPILDRDWRDWSSETRSESEELIKVEMRRREMRRRRGRE